MRKFLLIALSISTVVSICQNILIFLWYIGIFGDITRPVLSAGLPYSHSFFLRHTPFCGSRFDLHKGKWIQSSCSIPYNQIEAAQAFLHVLLASITLILSLIVILEKKKVKDRPKLPLPSQYAQIKRSPQQLDVASSINKISNGHSNSHNVSTIVTAAENRILPYSYERHNRDKRARIRPNSMPESNPDQYTRVRSKDLEQNNVRSSEIKKSLPNTTGRFQKSSDQQRRISTYEETGSRDFTKNKDFGRLPSGTLTSLISFDPKSRTLLRVREHRESDDDDAEVYNRIATETGSRDFTRNKDFGRLPSGTLTSLISFDPKSRTLLRVREHRESDDDDAEVYNRIATINLDSGIYERSRNNAIHSSANRLNMSSSQTLAGSRVKYPNQDSVPSVMAPVLVTNDRLREKSYDISSSDSGLPGSSCDWPMGHPTCRTEQAEHSNLKENGSICPVPSVMAPVLVTNDRLREKSYDISSSDSGLPGSSCDWPMGHPTCRTEQAEHSNLKENGSVCPGFFVHNDQLQPTGHKSNFQVETRDHNKAIGHYHSVKEFQLTTEPSGANVPIVAGAGLLV
ncbi:hypothetical protein DICVIV_03191 [Dictyocaulus viviparus]|uniref:Uncharacterized protein n=1 Tax=Dictyocaulus viviparus TaxID=29172 RepID=A0A0D8Y7W9_DICVI|nr:hypothetical protein DICVIV_03191 [Dictyocaulus viviparus]